MNDAGDCYYAVIFTAEMADNVAGYADMAHRMNVLVEKQPGYMGRSDRTEGKREITISYSLAVVDLVFWRYATLNRDYEMQFDKVINGSRERIFDR